MKDDNKIRREISILRKTVNKHKVILSKARSKADKLEAPLILAELKKKYEGRYFAIPNGVDGIKWTTYVYCIDVTSFIRGWDFIHANGRIIMFDDMGEKGISIRKTDTGDLISHYCEKEISRDKFTKGVKKIIHNLLLPLTDTK